MGIYTETIQKLYVAFYNRPADPLGLAYWENAMANGATAASIATEFGNQPEYTSLYSGMSVAARVDAIYQNLFGRSAEPAGLIYWGGILTANPSVVGQIVYDIMKGAQGTDATAVANKVTAATAFTNALDQTAEIVGYSGTAANAVARTWLTSVTDSAASLTAAQASIDTTITATANANNNAAGQTYTLTTGVDQGTAFTGGAGNDTFVGVINTPGGGAADQSTWTALDSINGGNGTDTLKINAITDFAVPGGVTVASVEAVQVNAAAKVGTFTADGTGNVDLSTVFSGATSVSITGGTQVDFKAPTTAAVTVTNATAGVEVVGGTTQTVSLAAQGGNLKLSGATGAISVTSAAQGTNTMTIDNGTSVTVNAGMSATAATTQGAITIGGTTKPTGAVSVTNTVSNAAGANSTGSAITVNGGSTVAVTQTATQAVATAAGANNTLTQGKVVVNGTDAITSVTVSQSAAVTAANTVVGVTGVTEVEAVTFKALAAGETQIINGLTFTAGAAGTTAAETAFAFANLDNGARQGYSTKGIYSGTWTANTFSSGNNSTDTVTFTGTKAGARTDLADTGTGANPTVVVSPDGVSAVTAAGKGGIVQGVVEIDDTGAEADTLTTVSVTGYATSSFVKSDALTTLTLAKDTAGASMAVHNNTATTLGLTLDTLATGSTVNLDAAAAKYTTLNINTTGGNSTAAITGAAVTALTVDGAKAVDLSGSSFGALQTVTVKGSAGVTLNASGATVTAVDTTATTGTSTITVDATKAKYTGGAGVDNVTLSAAAPSKNVSLGAGDDTLTLASTTTSATGVLSGGDGTDTLKMNMADAVTASASTSFQNAFDSFEKLSIVQASGGAAGTVDLANMDNINYVVSNNGSAVAAVAEVQTFTITGAATGTGNIVIAGGNVAVNAGDAIDVVGAAIAAAQAAIKAATVTVDTVTYDAASDTVTVTYLNTAGDVANLVANPNGQGVTFGAVAEGTKGVSAVAAAGLLTLDHVASGGTIELTGAGNGATALVTNAATGTADSLNVVLSSTAGIAAGTVTAANVESISINADDTATTATGINDTLTLVATKATSLTITGDANLNLTNTGNIALTTINASAMTGALTVTAAGTVAETITGGSGNDVLTASAAADVLIGGAGADTLTAGAGLATLTGGDGYDTFVIQTASTNVNSYATITDATKGDYIRFTDTAGAETFSRTAITLGNTAVFQDYANAAIATNTTQGGIVWFQYGGDTYIVQEAGNNAANTFTNGSDFIVKLTGTVDLSLASFDSAAIEIRLG